MDTNKNQTAEKLAERLLDFPEPQWDPLIEEWCAGNDELRQEVENIAGQNRNARSFVEEFQKRIYSLTKSSISSDNTRHNQIAGYKIIEKLGAGGSATVYLAENEAGEKGALKLLRGIGLDGYSRLRFESEQHILASLDHPNIARLIEGGITEKGDPYVLMEYVDGVPVDEWCDNQRLGIRDRIRLFQKVCSAVHYAHQNLVVHRDLKPEHVLITAEGDVKLIDFGIAKLLQPEHPEIAAFHTRTGMRIMTPEFASPEQVRGRHITTASDIYSLGVLLYLLLSGRKPYRINSTSMLEIEKIVCELDPLKPSDAAAGGAIQQLSDTPDDFFDPVETALRRGSEPGKLRKQLTGDLDRIVLMALWKEPHRRYASAQSLSDDLENYLKGEPVAARVPTMRYRVRKFVSRNKWAVSAAAFALLALISGLSGTLWQAHQANLNARQAQHHAEQAGMEAQRANQVTDFLVDLFEASDPGVSQGIDITVEMILERGVEQVFEAGRDPLLQLDLLAVLGRVYNAMGEYGKSSDLLEQGLAIAGEHHEPARLIVADIQNTLATASMYLGDYSKADSLLEKAQENYEIELGQEDPKTLRIMRNRVGTQAYLTRSIALADSMYQLVLDKQRSVLDPMDTDIGVTLLNLGYIKQRQRELDQTLELFTEAAGIFRNSLGEQHPMYLNALHQIALVYDSAGDTDNAETTIQRLIDTRINVQGENHPDLAASYFIYAGILKNSHRYQQAIENNKKAVEILTAQPGPLEGLPVYLSGLAGLYQLEGNTGLASGTFREASRVCSEIYGLISQNCARMNQTIGEHFLEQNQAENARIYLTQAYDGFRETMGEEHLARLEELLESVSTPVARTPK